MSKFDNLINTITDNIVLFLILFVIFSWLLRCSSPQQADTIRLQERTQSVSEQLDRATNDCNTDDCRKAIKQAKELIKDSLDIAINKDSEIAMKQKKIDNASLYTTVGEYVIWGSIVIAILGLLYVFRSQIAGLIRLVRPI